MTDENPREVMRRAADDFGCTVAELQKKVSRLDLGYTSFAAIAARPGWTEEFRARLERGERFRREQIEKTVTHAITGVFGDGPLAMAQLDDGKTDSLLASKLRTMVADYTPAHGNRIVCGPTATGKTLGLVAILKRLTRVRIETAAAEALKTAEAGGNSLRLGMQMISPGGPLLWTRAFDLGKARREHSLGAGDAKLVVQAKKAPVLVIDDLGWEPAKDETIPEILAERYDAKRVTLITTALTPEELKERYGTAVVRRALGDPETGKIISLFSAKPKLVTG